MENFETLVWSEYREPYGALTDEFVQRFDRYVNWSLVSQHYGLHAPLEMLRMYQHRFDWTKLLRYRLFTESFLREMYHNFDVNCWEVLSQHQRLSEDFIHDFALKVDWKLISKYQDVSGEFMTEHNSYLHPDDIPMTSGARRNSA